MRALLLACLLSVPGVQARAENWPEHGYYFVRDGMQGDHRYCELIGSLKVDRAIFALVIREFSSGSLMVQFLTQDATIDKAEQVVIGIDRKEILRFNPTIRDQSSELPSVAAFIESDQGAPIIERLRRAAKGAQWLQVAALPYAKAVPADGLKEAMDDLAACREEKRI